MGKLPICKCAVYFGLKASDKCGGIIQLTFQYSGESAVGSANLPSTNLNCLLTYAGCTEGMGITGNVAV